MPKVLYYICSLICSFLMYCTLGRFLEINSRLIKKVALYVSCFMVNSMIIYIGDLANMPPTFLAFLLAMQWACNGSFKKKLTIGFAISTAPFAINCLWDTFILISRRLGTESFIFLAFKLCFWIVLFVIISRFDIPNHFELSNRHWNVLLLISCIPFFILLSLIMIPDIMEYQESVKQTFICILIIIALSVIGILSAIIALFKTSQLEQQQLLYEVNDKYYKNMNTQMQQIRKLRHDLANHLQVLANMPEQEMKEYVYQLMSDKTMVTPMFFCRDSVINALLGSKYDYIEKSEISLRYEICLEEEHKLSPTDVCVLIGNLLDNAIEGCLRVEISRFIHLNISCSKGLFVIKILNSCLEKIDTARTSKREEFASHGFGIKSIEEVVARKKGTMQMKHENGEFEVFIVIPCESQSFI